MSTLTWITVPQGLRGDHARLSVLVVPRLSTGSTEGRLEDFGLRDWPARVADMSFEVRRRSGNQVHSADRSPTLLSTPDSAVWRAFFTGQAGTIAASEPRRPPGAPTVPDKYPDAVRAHQTHRRLARSIAADGLTPAARADLAGWSRRASTPSADDGTAPARPRVDFQGTAALLREHPRVMRALGLILDLEMDASFFDADEPADRALSVTTSDSPVPILAPWTRYLFDSRDFRPADTPGGVHRRGVLNLGDAVALADVRLGPDGLPTTVPAWLISTIDVDGAVDSLADAAASPGEGRQALLPRARSAGFNLVRPGRAADFQRLLARSLPDQVGEAELTADDLMLGYRVDIRRGSAPWRSVCERHATYSVQSADGPTLAIGEPGPEENQVKPNSMVKHADGSITADQTLLRWDGWSLALPPPASSRSSRRTTTHLPYNFSWRYDVLRDADGTPLRQLPALRFAERYRMRVRVADITGGGPALDDPDLEDAATPSVLYTRHQPVDPPALNATDPLPLGATDDVLVVSSDTDDDQPSVTRRTMVPPIGSFQLAEQHRMFDDPVMLDVARRAFEGSLRNASSPLPDPAAEGVFAYAPAEDGGLVESWEGEAEWAPWPAGGVKRVELIGLSDPHATTSLDFEPDQLTVQLPRGEQVTVELSSTIRDNFLDHFTIHDWITGGDVPQAWSAAALRGRHPLLSPVRRLTFVHVVRRPLAVPRWTLPDPTGERDAGDTSALLAPTFEPTGLDTDSTARLEVAASWTDWSDDGPHATAAAVHAATIDRGAPFVAPFRHEFGDTRHRVVSYDLTAITRFRHFFPDTEPDERFQQRAIQAGRVNVLSSGQPKPPTVLATVPAFAWSTTTEPTRLVRRRQVALRVELGRPWFTTGEGELLAVLVAPPATTPDDDLPVSRIGCDPVSATGPTPHFPPATWFAGAARPIDLVELPGTDHQVHAVAYEVQRRGERRYADIWLAVPADVDSYAPFVHLVVARYQPDSIAGCALSTPAACDIVKLPPERTLTLDLTADGIVVILDGCAPHGSNRVQALIDTLPAAADPTTADLVAIGAEPLPFPAWVSVDGAIVTGTVGRPLPPLLPPRTNDHVRIRVREIESIPPDPDADCPPELAEQTPFLDFVELPDSWR